MTLRSKQPRNLAVLAAEFAAMADETAAVDELERVYLAPVLQGLAVAVAEGYQEVSYRLMSDFAEQTSNGLLTEGDRDALRDTLLFPSLAQARATLEDKRRKTEEQLRRDFHARLADLRSRRPAGAGSVRA